MSGSTTRTRSFSVSGVTHFDFAKKALTVRNGTMLANQSLGSPSILKRNQADGSLIPTFAAFPMSGAYTTRLLRRSTAGRMF
jgi:hypothetical protein